MLLLIPFLLGAGGVVAWIRCGSGTGRLHERERTGLGDRVAEHVEVRVRTPAGRGSIALIILAMISLILHTNVGLLVLPLACS